MSAARPWLSVLVPVYNVQDYLDDCVASVLKQADDGVELVLMDDASTDGSLALMQALAARHPGRIRLLQAARNGGLSATRNRLLEASQGEWIWFLDSDDFLLDGALPALREQTCRADVDLVMCDFCDHRERSTLKHRLRGEAHRRTNDLPPREVCRDVSAVLASSFLRAHLHSWSKVSRRELWGSDLRFPEGKYFEDIATTPALLRARATVYVPEVWVAYRKRPGSILATGSAKKTDDMLGGLDGLPALLAAHQPPVSPAARLAAGYFVAKIYAIAARDAQRRDDLARQAHYAQLFERNLPVSLDALLRFFLRRGWFWRALRLRHWLRVGRQARLGLPEQQPQSAPHP